MNAGCRSVRVKLFAAARQAAGRDLVEVPLAEGATVADLRRALVAQVPGLASLAAVSLFAVNANYAANDSVIPPGAEVACIPPVSGG